MGLLEKKSGHIIVGGIELTEETLSEVRSQIGIVFQNPDNQFIGATVRDDIAFGLENTCVDPSLMDGIIEEYAKKVNMYEFLDHEPTKLSGGQKQRLAIACALTKETPILILDEPTSALDTENARIIFEILSELKKEKTIIITSHNQIAREYCDEVVQIEDGIITKIVSKDIQEKPIKIIQKGTHLPLKTYFNLFEKTIINFSKKMKIFISL